jgi:PTS system nitrogen regulatory IIA component
MPHRILSLDEVAQYLHLARPDVEQLVKRKEIPFEQRGDRWVFRRTAIDAWASQRILGLSEKGLHEYHRRSSDRLQRASKRHAIMPELLKVGHIDPRMTSRTKASVLRDIVALAERTGQVLDTKGLVDSLQERERLCSTGMPGGLALLHPRHHDPYMFESDFIVLGRTIQAIPFGAPDGSSTDLFFLICCRSDNIHLHTLARFCVMAQKTELLSRLRELDSAAELLESILAAEYEILGQL